MSLDIGAALRDGASRTTERNALALMAAFVVLGLATTVVLQSFYAWYFEFLTTLEGAPTGVEAPPTPLSVPLPIGVTLAAWLAVALLAEATRIVAIRVFVSEERRAIPGHLARRNLPLAVLNGFVGGLVVSVLVGLGTLALVLPGIFLAVSFYFVRQRIAVEDENFVDAMVESWSLSKGDRIELAVLALVVVVVSLSVFLPVFGLQLVVGRSSVVPPLVQSVVRAPLVVFGIAVAARAYVQLAGAEETAGPSDDTDDGDGDADADEEWPDPPGVDI